MRRSARAAQEVWPLIIRPPSSTSLINSRRAESLKKDVLDSLARVAAQIKKGTGF